MVEMILLNKNIPIDEAKKMVSDGQKKRQGLFDKIIENSKELPINQRVKYISSCIPFITML